MTRRVSILGATGSIGVNTLDLIARDPDAFDVVALTGGRNIALLAQQARQLQAEMAVTAYDDCYESLKSGLADTNIEVAAGEAALLDAATRPADWIMSAIVGAAGLPPSLAAAAQGTTLALANKESLVTAGPLLMEIARQANAKIVPVDSEHSAIFQALQGEDSASVERVIITASGGAFRDWPLERLASATPEQACAHPNWDMGQRITIDSASMFNKALELIETKEYFELPEDKIEAIIHPESLVHALVGHVDGGLIAHVGPHDMRHAIGYALHYPNRAHAPVERLDLAKIGQLNFYAPDPARYPALELAREVMRIGGLAGSAFIGAKDEALDGFIGGDVGFTDMADIVRDVIEIMSTQRLGNAAISLDSVCQADQEARKHARAIIERKR